MTLTERLRGKPIAADHGFLAERFLRGWASRYDRREIDWFERRLSADRVNEHDLRILLAEPMSALLARVAKPEWAHRVELAVAAAPAQLADSVDTHWRTAFAQVLAPFRDLCMAELINRSHSVPRGQHVDLDRLAGEFGRELGERLVDLAVRTFVQMLANQRGQLVGTNGEQRFAYFVRKLGTRAGLIALFSEYPVLARVLAETGRRSCDGYVETLSRFTTDHEQLISEILGGVDPGALVSIQTGRGDPHRGGRSVSILTFASGARVVYKPRDLTAEARLADLIGFLNGVVPDLRLRTASVVVRPGYGWMEHVEPAPLPTMSSAFLFYRRLGALLAILHLLHASDMHCENLVAAADQPVLVDAETLFHPPVGQPADPAAAWLGTSVVRTRLLPSLTVGAYGAVDLSGVGGDAGLAPLSSAVWQDAGTDRMRLAWEPRQRAVGLNRPTVGGVPVEPARHKDAVLAGFREAYDAMAGHREEFVARLRTWADVPVRVVVRPTRGYAVLLDESTHPDVLRDAVHRDLLFDLLWTESVGRPLWWRLAAHERDDLWCGDIPLFTTTPAHPAVHTSGGHPVADALTEPLLPVVLAKLAAFGPADRERQEWLISATLASRSDRQPGPLDTPGATAPGTPQQLLDAACGIADDLVAQALTADGRVNWVGLQRVEGRHWMVLPMGASLADGYLGVALFLSELAALTGMRSYANAARHAGRALPDLLDTLGSRAELITAVGCDGYHGFGGMAYALARMSTLIDSGLRPLAERAIELAAAHGGGGWAGCQAAMTAVGVELGSARAHEVAGQCPLVSHDDNRYAALNWALAARDGRPHPADLFAMRDLSLGHGALGVADAILVGGEPAAPDLDQLRGAALSLLAAAGPRCATPDAVPTTGLFEGTAGIGLGLLRLAFPDRVPSVLLLHPSPIQERTGSHDTRPQPAPGRSGRSTEQPEAA